jgi:hypothetical protein
MDDELKPKMKTTFCPYCRVMLPVETYLNSDICPDCGKPFHAETYQMVVGIAALVTMIFTGLAAFSQDPRRWEFAGFMSAAIAVWALLVIVTDRLLIKFTRMPRGARSWITMPVATAFFLALLFLWGR